MKINIAVKIIIWISNKDMMISPWNSINNLLLIIMILKLLASKF